MYDVRPMRPNLAPVFQGIAQRDMQFITAAAVTAVAGKVQEALTEELGRAIDRPTPFTQKAVLKRPRKQGAFFAYEVYIRDDATKGTPPSKYLAPLIYGGQRRQKRSEKALAMVAGRRAGALYAMPGLGASLDAYGNMRAGQIRQVLSYVGAAEMMAGYQANSTAKLKGRLRKGGKRTGKRGMAYFVSGGPGSNAGRSKGNQHLAAGIWQRTYFGWGSAIKPVMIFTKSATYTPRIRFYETVQNTVNQEWGAAFQKAMWTALSSSKRVS